MKRLFTSALTFVLGLAIPIFAQERVLTVDNNPGHVAMFKSIHDAYEAAQPGDTLLLAGSSIHYGGLAVKKRLNIVGPGYFLNENSIPGLSKSHAMVNLGLGITPDTSSGGSTFRGLFMNIGIDASVGSLIDRIDNVLIDQCYLGPDAASLHFPNRVTIQRSFIAQGNGYDLRLLRPGSSLRNSISTKQVTLDAGTTIVNCVLTGSGLPNLSELSSMSSTICLFGERSPAEFAGSVRGSVTYCMAAGPITGANYLPPGGGNINGVAYEVVFVGTGSEDARLQLRPDSPARGKGFNGVDMGIFGGPLPYVISGVPSRPRITRFVVPAEVTSASGLRFELDAQAF